MTLDFLHDGGGGATGLEGAGSSAELPGASATTVSVPSLLNSMPRWVLRSHSTLRGFLLSILSSPWRSSSSPTTLKCPPTWPMPIPYPEAFSKHGCSDERSGSKKLVSLQVACLSWLQLGMPSTAPSCLALGAKLSSGQWSVVKYLEHLGSDGNTPNSVDAAFMARSATKVESLEATLDALGRACAFLKEEEKSYFTGTLSRPAEQPRKFSMGRSCGRIKKPKDLVARPLVASRLQFPGPPAFDLCGYFDSATKAWYERPLDLRLSPEQVAGEVPSVRVFADAFNKVELYKKLADTKRLQPVLAASKCGPYVSGLFSVVKDSTRDRMVLDGRPPNILEPHNNVWRGAMANPNLLGHIWLDDHMVLLSSGEDLRDFFYQFRAGDQRTKRNILSDPLTLKEAQYVFGPSFSWPEDPVWVGLSSLAMGDTLACEYAQSSHVAICLRHGVASPQELLTLKDPLPRGLLHVGIIIDDLVVLEQCLRSQLQDIQLGNKETEADRRLLKAQTGYEMAGLETNPKKRFSNEYLARFWGMEIDGLKGLVRASSSRLWPTMLVTLRVASLGLATIGLLESLAGSWIAILGCRRRMFCVMEIIFEALSIEDQQVVIRLSPALIGELLTLVILAPLAAVDLRSSFSQVLVATDASLDAMAAVVAPIPKHVSQELFRTGLTKGRWTQLLSPHLSWKKQHHLLSPDMELEDPYTIHPLWELCARGLKFKEVWREMVSKPQHINLLEAKAYLREERRLSVQQAVSRIPFALDSQVCLGAFTKGRSSSVALNKLLKRNLAYPIGGGIFSAYMYFASALNRADAPTRDADPPPPDWDLPKWFEGPADVFFAGLDEWLASIGADQSCALPFDNLNNGDCLDLSPASSQKLARVPNAAKVNISAVDHFLSPVSKLQEEPSNVSSPEVFSTSLCDEAISILKKFDIKQFFGVDSFQQLTGPGALDLYSGNFAVCKQMIKHGAPWVLSVEIKRSPRENLLDASLQQDLLRLVELGVFQTVGMAPVCSSFSRAITPMVRSRRWPRGCPWVKGDMLRKIQEGNQHSDFCSAVITACCATGTDFWCENPDTSFLWQQRGLKQFLKPDSKKTFRCSFCRFGTRWKKNTKFATSLPIAGLRMMCKCGKRPHQVLRGYSRLHGRSWTSVAEPYPRGVSKLLAVACCVAAGWCESRALNVANCARLGSLRAGEAKNPGPPKFKGPRSSLHEVPLVSGATLAMESRLLGLFVEWCRSEVQAAELDEVFDAAPHLLVVLLKFYGDMMFQDHKSLSNFRHLLLAAQRWKPLVKPMMQPAWDYVARWEAQEPVMHRVPIPEQLLKAFVVMAFHYKWFSSAAATLVAFYGGARLGEILQCTRSDVMLPRDCMELGYGPIFVRLRNFKSKLRQPAKVQHLRVSDAPACKLLNLLIRRLPPDLSLFGQSPYQYRKRWNALLDIFGISKQLRVTPGGLRGGFAVSAYRAGRPVQDIQWSMRLRSQVTLECYLQEAAALNAFAALDESVRSDVLAAAQLFPFLPATSL